MIAKKCFENYLIDRHAEQYTGLDDDMPDDWNEWVTNLDVDTLIQYADAWGKTILDDFIKRQTTANLEVKNGNRLPKVNQ